MDHFVQELMSMRPLEPDEERTLATRARAGDRKARDALITSGLRSVALRARMLGMRGEDLRDAVQSGTIGLIRAVDRFDPDRGVRLATYAWHWIGAEMRGARAGEVPVGALEPATAEPAYTDAGLLEGLRGDQAEVLRMRFGISNPWAEPMSRRAVAERLGLSVSQVRTIEGKAMRQLRRGLAKVVDRAPHQ